VNSSNFRASRVHHFVIWGRRGLKVRSIRKSWTRDYHLVITSSRLQWNAAWEHCVYGCMKLDQRDVYWTDGDVSASTRRRLNISSGSAWSSPPSIATALRSQWSAHTSWTPLTTSALKRCRHSACLRLSVCFCMCLHLVPGVTCQLTQIYILNFFLQKKYKKCSFWCCILVSHWLRNCVMLRWFYCSTVLMLLLVSAKLEVETRVWLTGEVVWMHAGRRLELCAYMGSGVGPSACEYWPVLCPVMSSWLSCVEVLCHWE